MGEKFLEVGDVASSWCFSMFVFFPIDGLS